MANVRLSDDLARQALDAVERAGGNQSEAARQLGIPRETFQHRLREARSRNLDSYVAAKPFDVPELPSELPTIDELKRLRRDEWRRVNDAKKARKLIPIKIKIDGPIGIAHMGDPHVDDPGTNYPLLEAHTQLIDRTEGLFGATVGDIQNNWIGRLARLYGEQNTSARASWILAEDFVRSVHWLYMIAGNHDCVDTETEALTKRGWLKHNEISPIDEVLGLNTETGLCEWQPILGSVRKTVDRLYRIETRNVSLAGSAGHRVLHQTRDWKGRWRPWTYSAVSDLRNDHIQLPIAARSGDDDHPISDELIRVAGWLMTDATIHRPMNAVKFVQVTFFQRESKAALVCAALDAAGIEYSTRVRVRDPGEICGVVVKSAEPGWEMALSAQESRRLLALLDMRDRKSFPAWAWELSDRQFDILLEALVDGDGTRYEHATSMLFYKSEPIIDELQALCVMHGYAAHKAVFREKDYRLNILPKSTQIVVAAKRWIEEGPAEVWCLTVPLSNFLVRRNGKAHFTGNCWTGAGDPLQWMMRAQGGVLEAHGARLNLVFPNGREVRVNARHDFTGHSMWNTAHGPAKAAQSGWRDHILTCGHKHTSGYQVLKDPSTGLISHAIRVASYKHHDRYADEKGLPDQNIFECPVTIINPDAADERGLVTTIFWPEEGAEYLTWLRKRWASGKRAR